MRPCVLIYSSLIGILHSEEKPEGNCFYRSFFVYSKKNIFKSDFGPFLDREEQSKNKICMFYQADKVDSVLICNVCESKMVDLPPSSTMR